MGADDGSSEIPPMENQNPMGTIFLGHPVNPPNHGQVGRFKIQVVVRNKRT